MTSRRNPSSSWIRRNIDTCEACSTRHSPPRAIQSQRETVIELVQHYLSQADPDNFDVVQDFSGPFPVEVITRMAGVPEEFRQQVRHWIDKGLEREPGQIEWSEKNIQANIDSGVYY